MGNAGELTRALIQRVPGQSLVEKLLSEWDAGRIHLGDQPDQVVIDEDARGWYWGVLGERRVADILSGLGREWTVLHSVPVGSGSTDIDHVAIGPSGVFVINTKYSPGSDVWVAGRGLIVNGSSRAKYLRSSMAELERATNLLSTATGFAVPVHSVLVFVAPSSLTVKDYPGWDGITLNVIADDGLPALLGRRREMSGDQITRVLDVALEAGTWHRSPQPSAPGRNYAREFDALRDAVGPGLESTRPAAVARPDSPPRAVRPPRSRRAPAASRSRTPRPTRRRRRSLSSELMSIAFPVAGLIGVWYFFTNVYGK
jgi:hypothetical protein